MSLDRLEEHRSIWSGKPVLRAVYGPWFDALLAEAGPGQRVLEVGAGPGFMAAHAVELVYRPPGLVAGLILSALSILAACVLAWRTSRATTREALP